MSTPNSLKKKRLLHDLSNRTAVAAEQAKKSRNELSIASPTALTAVDEDYSGSFPSPNATTLPDAALSSSVSSTIQSELQNEQVDAATESSKPNANDILVQKMIETKEVQEDEGQLRDKLDAIFEQQARDKLRGLRMLEMPPQLVTTLLQHQVQGVSYFCQLECHGGPSLFTKFNFFGKDKYKCQITRKHKDEEPKPVHGGILADDMGLGKTLQMIGLTLANPPAGVVYPCKSQGIKRKTPRTTLAPTCTIIVCPVSVIANWELQVAKHVEKGALRTAIYAGHKRRDIIEQIRNNKIDIVYVSYGTLSSDYKIFHKAHEEAAAKAAAEQKRSHLPTPKHQEEPSEDENESVARIVRRTKPTRNVKTQRNSLHDDESVSSVEESEQDSDYDSTMSGSEDEDEDYENEFEEPTLFDLEFHRIILDEGHNIRNSKTVFFASANALQAKRRIVLSGTPFMNKPADLQSLFTFLKLEPVNCPTIFHECITSYIESKRPIGLARLRLAMNKCMLRRTKNTTTIEMVEKTQTIVKVNMPKGEHKRIHDVVFSTAQTAFTAALQVDGEKVPFWAMFSLVTRIRQACCHGKMVPRKGITVAEALALECEEAGGNLTAGEGLLMLEKLASAFSRVKKEKNDSGSDNGEGSDDEEDLDDESDDEEEEDEHKFGISPKIAAVLNLIDKMAPDEKGVLFCTFTKHLDYVEEALVQHGHSCTRIDGSMNAQARLEAMNAFNQEGIESSPRFILCSLMAAGTGINLTRGNVAFMLSPWWNYSAENQALDRVHRLGQTRPVRAYRLVIADSLEERLLKIQKHKTVTGKGSMAKLSKKDEPLVKITAMKDLFDVANGVGVAQFYESDHELDNFIVEDSEEN